MRKCRWWPTSRGGFSIVWANIVLMRKLLLASIVFVSAASAWEAAIKIALGRLTLPEPFSRGVDHSGFRRLAISFEHGEAAAALPHHHGDPFDRMLIAQAQLEGCTLVTHDELIASYGVATLWT